MRFAKPAAAVRLGQGARANERGAIVPLSRVFSRTAKLLSSGVICISLVGCGAATTARPDRTVKQRTATWTGRGHVRGVVDLSAPRRDGSIVVAAAGRLLVRSPDAGIRSFAPSYRAPPGLEPYIALSSRQALSARRCRFGDDGLYALRLRDGNGVTVVDSRLEVRRFARLPRRGLEDGIAFDRTGSFGHRLLVTLTASGRTTLFAIDCRGRVDVVTRDAPRVEGGIVVAPRTFGRFAGDLIAPDELSGNLYAIQPDGRAILVARSGLPRGQDVGVESEGFVPARFNAALVADRGTPGNRHPGDDLILGIDHAALSRAGVRSGDLLVVSEGGAKTIAVSCQTSCRVIHVADGPPGAHIEGHVVFSHQTAAPRG